MMFISDPEADWNYLKKNIESLTDIPPTTISWHNFFCVPGYSIQQNASINNLKFFLDLVDSEDMADRSYTDTDKFLIINGLLCYLDYTYQGWQQWLSKPGFLSQLNDLIVSDPTTKEASLKQFQSFIETNKPIIFERHDDRLTFLLPQVSFEQVEATIAEQLETTQKPGFFQTLFS